MEKKRQRWQKTNNNNSPFLVCLLFFVFSSLVARIHVEGCVATRRHEGRVWTRQLVPFHRDDTLLVVRRAQTTERRRQRSRHPTVCQIDRVGVHEQPEAAGEAVLDWVVGEIQRVDLAREARREGEGAGELVPGDGEHAHLGHGIERVLDSAGEAVVAGLEVEDVVPARDAGERARQHVVGNIERRELRHLRRHARRDRAREVVLAQVDAADRLRDVAKSSGEAARELVTSNVEGAHRSHQGHIREIARQLKRRENNSVQTGRHHRGGDRAGDVVEPNLDVGSEGEEGRGDRTCDGVEAEVNVHQIREDVPNVVTGKSSCKSVGVEVKPADAQKIDGAVHAEPVADGDRGVRGPASGIDPTGAVSKGAVEAEEGLLLGVWDSRLSRWHEGRRNDHRQENESKNREFHLFFFFVL
eukprot:PhM_4_TR187/c0_g1_i1/m.5738